jgi:hypothetical protein
MSRTITIPDRIEAWPALDQLIPLSFGNKSTVTHLSIVCGHCRKPLPTESTKARISQFPETVASCTTFALCRYCGYANYTHFRIRASEHGFQTEEEREGRKLIYNKSRSRLIDQIGRLFKHRKS